MLTRMELAKAMQSKTYQNKSACSLLLPVWGETGFFVFVMDESQTWISIPWLVRTHKLILTQTYGNHIYALKCTIIPSCISLRVTSHITLALFLELTHTIQRDQKYKWGTHPPVFTNTLHSQINRCIMLLCTHTYTKIFIIYCDDNGIQSRRKSRCYSCGLKLSWLLMTFLDIQWSKDIYIITIHKGYQSSPDQELESKCF